MPRLLQAAGTYRWRLLFPVTHEPAPPVRLLREQRKTWVSLPGNFTRNRRGADLWLAFRARNHQSRAPTGAPFCRDFVRRGECPGAAGRFHCIKLNRTMESCWLSLRELKRTEARGSRVFFKSIQGVYLSGQTAPAVKPLFSCRYLSARNHEAASERFGRRRALGYLIHPRPTRAGGQSSCSIASCKALNWASTSGNRAERVCRSPALPACSSVAARALIAAPPTVAQAPLILWA